MTAREFAERFYPAHAGHTVTRAWKENRVIQLACSCGEQLRITKAALDREEDIDDPFGMTGALRNVCGMVS